MSHQASHPPEMARWGVSTKLIEPEHARDALHECPAPAVLGIAVRMPNAAYGPQPETENVKLTFTCPVSLKADLDRYAALRAQTCGEAVDAAKFIPHMLEASIERAAPGCAFFIQDAAKPLGL